MTRLFSHWFSPDKKLSAALKNVLGFYPANIALYQMALRHKSLTRGDTSKIITNNERLEFLGDALLDAVVADHLFHKFPYKDEGFLTKMRSKIVSRQHLNSLALKMGLQNMLSKEGGISPGSSIYGNALEALIGSIYLDKGFTVAKKFILNRLFELYIDMDELENTETDFKSKLTEWAQKEKKSLEFKVLKEAKNHNDRNFHVGVFINTTVQGEASHFSKKRAEQMAAEKAWVLINRQI
ncbi:MAG TPA: ribonuclease III [Bacteroidia bacterium]|nr:ribonuclease III [Bacteroidia bacterium]